MIHVPDAGMTLPASALFAMVALLVLTVRYIERNSMSHLGPSLTGGDVLAAVVAGAVATAILVAATGAVNSRYVRAVETAFSPTATVDGIDGSRLGFTVDGHLCSTETPAWSVASADLDVTCADGYDPRAALITDERVAAALAKVKVTGSTPVTWMRASTGAPVVSGHRELTGPLRDLVTKYGSARVATALRADQRFVETK